MVRKIEQFQKMRNYASVGLSSYEKQEMYAQFPLWEECLNSCSAQLYAKTREGEGEEVHSWREHPFDSYACFIKNHKKLTYSIRVFDIDRDGVGDKMLDLVLVTAGEYRIESLRGKETLVFASNKYLIGVCPDDTDTENEHFRDNVLNAIGNWWYVTKRHSWKSINKAVEKMKTKSIGKQVLTVDADPTPVPRRSCPQEPTSNVVEKTPSEDLQFVYLNKPRVSKEPEVNVLSYEVQEHRRNILDFDEVQLEESTTMVLVTADTAAPVKSHQSNMSAITDSGSIDSIAWSDDLVTPRTSLQEAGNKGLVSLREAEKQVCSSVQEAEKEVRTAAHDVGRKHHSSGSPGRRLYKAEEVATTVFYSDDES